MTNKNVMLHVSLLTVLKHLSVDAPKDLSWDLTSISGAKYYLSVNTSQSFPKKKQKRKINVSK